MGSSKPVTPETAILYGASRGYDHAVLLRSPGKPKLSEIRDWLTQNYYRRSYFRWHVNGLDGYAVVWCFRDPDLAFSFKMRFA